MLKDMGGGGRIWGFPISFVYGYELNIKKLLLNYLFVMFGNE